MYIHNLGLVIKSIPRQHAIFVEGPPGVGKTHMVYQSIEQGEHFFEFQAPSALPEDIRGLPDLTESSTTWKLPYFIHLLSYDVIDEEPDESVVGTILIDELPSAQPAVHLVFQKLFQERRIDRRKLHPNVRVIACGNRKEDAANVTDLPGPLRSKMTWIHIEPHLGGRYPDEPKGWIQTYAQPNNIDHRIISFLRSQPGLFCDTDPQKFRKACPNPRSWVRVHETMQSPIGKAYLLPPDELDREARDVINSQGFSQSDAAGLFQEVIGGVIGEGPAVDFFTHLEFSSKVPSIQEIQRLGSKAHYVKEPGFQFAACGQMLSYLKDDLSIVDPVLNYLSVFEDDFMLFFLADLTNMSDDAFNAVLKSDAFRNDRFREAIKRLRK